jgi:hypothetical protein
LAASNHVIGCQQLGRQQPRGWLPTTMWLAANNHVFACQQLCGWLPTAMWLAANNNDVVEKKNACSGQTVVVLRIPT